MDKNGAAVFRIFLGEGNFEKGGFRAGNPRFARAHGSRRPGPSFRTNRVFRILLIRYADGQDCEGKRDISARSDSPTLTTSTTTLTQRRETTKPFVAQLRTRLDQGYHSPVSER